MDGHLNGWNLARGSTFPIGKVPCTTRIGGIGRHAARDREIVLRKRFHVEHVEVVPRVGRPQQAAIAQDFHSCL